ncbi:hypothetical protein [Thermococcus sp. 21S7]|uniref:hypothetical protein n=1 Tax=Thermococcus sp. 21S7 TaxID=1638221 RepID=UPI00143AC45F|nr:hypothetical protein [Thermococcus sp. 21S7]
MGRMRKKDMTLRKAIAKGMFRDTSIYREAKEVQRISSVQFRKYLEDNRISLF